ncbi:hypothetical protein LTR74_012963 [Friedmanniomyces endolithicus]|nr:hypothetical protein LTR74_012963 [Friedmanniomyces endolithicus]
MYPLFLSLLLLPTVLAQATCDPAAIASVNCTNADQYCHCVRQMGILTNITSCADKTCSNPSADIHGIPSLLFASEYAYNSLTNTHPKVFTTLFGQVCAKYNISVPVLGSNSSTNGTNVTFPSPMASAVPYTGVASVGPQGCGVVVIVLAVGLGLAMAQL